MQISRCIALPNNGKRLAPIALARKKPVAEFVIDCLLAKLFFFEPGGDFRFGFRRWQTGDETRIDAGTVANKADGISAVGRLNDDADWQIELFANSKSRSSWPGTAMIAPVP